MLTDFYCQELLLSCTTGTAKWILLHRPSLESVQTLICNSESILCSSSPQPVSHLQCSQLCYLPFNNILPSAPRFGFYSWSYFLTLICILLEIPYLSTGLHCTAHFIHNVYLATRSTNFLTPSPSILLYLLMAALPQIHLSPSPFPSCSIASYIVHYRQTPGS